MKICDFTKPGLVCNMSTEETLNEALITVIEASF